MRRILLPLLLSASAWAGMGFVHPGALDSREELDFVKAKIAAGEQPWTAKFYTVRTFARAAADTVAPVDGNENAQRTDALRAYANALVWRYTGDAKYAEQGIGILNLWARSFAGYALPPEGQGNQGLLNAAWIGALLGPAAEILRDYPSWKPTDLALVQDMFRTRFYPALEQMSPWNGNVDLTQIDAMMNLAVFNEDEALFNAGLERLRRRDSAYFYLSTDQEGARTYGGSSPSSWSDASGNAPLKWVDGLTQETCRDNGHHAQFALASTLHAAEVAWHQGVDVYAENTARFTSAMELLATQLQSGDMQGTCLNPTASTDFYNTWEIGYNHYHNRKGIELPATWQLISQKTRARGLSDWNIFYESLTHAEVAAPASGIGTARRSPDVSFNRDGSLRLRAERSGNHEVTVLGWDGTRQARASLFLEAGQEGCLPLRLEGRASGLHLVQVRIGSESRTFKLAR